MSNTVDVNKKHLKSSIEKNKINFKEGFRALTEASQCIITAETLAEYKLEAEFSAFLLPILPTSENIEGYINFVKQNSSHYSELMDAYYEELEEFDGIQETADEFYARMTKKDFGTITAEELIKDYNKANALGCGKKFIQLLLKAYGKGGAGAVATIIGLGTAADDILINGAGAAAQAMVNRGIPNSNINQVKMSSLITLTQAGTSEAVDILQDYLNKGEINKETFLAATARMGGALGVSVASDALTAVLVSAGAPYAATLLIPAAAGTAVYYAVDMVGDRIEGKYEVGSTGYYRNGKIVTLDEVTDKKGTLNNKVYQDNSNWKQISVDDEAMKRLYRTNWEREILLNTEKSDVKGEGRGYTSAIRSFTPQQKTAADNFFKKVGSANGNQAIIDEAYNELESNKAFAGDKNQVVYKKFMNELIDVGYINAADLDSIVSKQSIYDNS